MQKILIVEDDIDIQDILKNHLIAVSYTHLDVYKRQAVAQRLGITATTLEGILSVKGQGRR